MIRVVSLVKLTDEGARAIENFGQTVAKVRESVTKNGGALEHAWQTAGIYDFVAVLSFRTLQPSSGRGTRSTSSGPSGSITFLPSRYKKHSTSPVRKPGYSRSAYLRSYDTRTVRQAQKQRTDDPAVFTPRPWWQVHSLIGACGRGQRATDLEQAS
jgi:hypothetical protein